MKRQERPGPLSAYDSLIHQGELNDDDHQRTIVKSLQDLFDKISGYRPTEPGFFNKVHIYPAISNLGSIWSLIAEKCIVISMFCCVGNQFSSKGFWPIVSL